MGRMGIAVGFWPPHMSSRRFRSQERSKTKSKWSSGQSQAQQRTSVSQDALSGPCFIKFPLPEMGKPGHKETNHFVSIYLSTVLNNSLVWNPRKSRPCPISFRNIFVSRGEISTHSSILEGSLEIKCHPPALV